MENGTDVVYQIGESIYCKEEAGAVCCNQISVCTQSPKCTEPLISFFKEVLVVLHHSLSLDQKFHLFATGGWSQ